jgi:hypothetical protein
MASEAEDTEYHPAKRPRFAFKSESIPINKQFSNIHDTNVTLESAEGVLFYISDFYLKVASYVSCQTDPIVLLTSVFYSG